MTERRQPQSESFDDGTRFLEEDTQLSDESMLPSRVDILRPNQSSAQQPFQMTSPFIKPLHFVGDIDELEVEE